MAGCPCAAACCVCTRAGALTAWLPVPAGAQVLLADKKTAAGAVNIETNKERMKVGAAARWGAPPRCYTPAAAALLDLLPLAHRPVELPSFLHLGIHIERRPRLQQPCLRPRPAQVHAPHQQNPMGSP